MGFWKQLPGQLGLGDSYRRPFPIQIPEVKAKQIAIGEYSSAFIDLDNNVWTSGGNYNGQLGLGDNKDRDIPTQILTVSELTEVKAKHISIGNGHMGIIDLDDNVWTCGGNNKEQLGLGDTKNRNLPCKIPNVKATKIIAGNNITAIIEKF